MHPDDYEWFSVRTWEAYLLLIGIGVGLIQLLGPVQGGLFIVGILTGYLFRTIFELKDDTDRKEVDSNEEAREVVSYGDLDEPDEPLAQEPVGIIRDDSTDDEEKGRITKSSTEVKAGVDVARRENKPPGRGRR